MGDFAVGFPSSKRLATTSNNLIDRYDRAKYDVYITSRHRNVPAVEWSRGPKRVTTLSATGFSTVPDTDYQPQLPQKHVQGFRLDRSVGRSDGSGLDLSHSAGPVSASPQLDHTSAAAAGTATAHAGGDAGPSPHQASPSPKRRGDPVTSPTQTATPTTATAAAAAAHAHLDMRKQTGRDSPVVHFGGAHWQSSTKTTGGTPTTQRGHRTTTTATTAGPRSHSPSKQQPQPQPQQAATTTTKARGDSPHHQRPSPLAGRSPPSASPVGPLLDHTAPGPDLHRMTGREDAPAALLLGTATDGSKVEPYDVKFGILERHAFVANFAKGAGRRPLLPEPRPEPYDPPNGRFGRDVRGGPRFATQSSREQLQKYLEKRRNLTRNCNYKVKDDLVRLRTVGITNRSALEFKLEEPIRGTVSTAVATLKRVRPAIEQMQRLHGTNASNATGSGSGSGINASAILTGGPPLAASPSPDNDDRRHATPQY